MKSSMIERYAPSDWPPVASLLKGWPFKPLIGHARWASREVAALCLARVEGVLSRPQTVAWIARSGASVVGLASLSVLPWDSEQIGLSAARLDYLVAIGDYQEQGEAKQALLAQVLQHGTKHDVQHLSVRLDAADLSGLHVLEGAGFITVDGILTFALALGGVPAAEPDEAVAIRLAAPADGEAAADLARQAYVYDRFHSDPAIPKERADELHAVWLRNSCAGRAADAVVLAEDGEGLLGFVTCKLQRDTKPHLGQLVGTIVMVATAERARRRGIGRAATLAALDWFHQQGAEVVEVGTQLRNIPASRLYQSCGFRLVGSSLSLRKLL